ncbi:Dbl homology domain-containing protein [Rhizopus microsporus]|uniref:Dbl homology domain-containing protein n=2 Tax=Rhizopus TaxID=4842 RepID=A0A1X0RQ13_RHIZD|nr:Dbl homology domain-containing protein [Rhizopus microsporus]
MMEFNQKGNQPTSLYNYSSHNSSISRPCSISTASSTGSIISDPYNLSFLTDNPQYYNQLVEDLSIIDNVYDILSEECENDTDLNDKQVLDVARYVAYKQQIISQIIQSETNYVNEFYDFQEIYATSIRDWLDTNEDKEVNAKMKSTPARKTLDTLFETFHHLSTLHSNFLKELNERFKIWGPTQLISDVFNNFYKGLGTYDTFFNQHPEFVMTLDILYRLPSFAKFIETKMNENKQRQSSLKIADLMHYLQIPLTRTSYYAKAINQLKHYSDPSTPDFTFLCQLTDNFRSLDREWSERKKSCQSHLMVLEVYRTVQGCPVNVTLNRRLILFADLIKVDVDDVTATSDVRTYYLYSDHLIFCRKQKDKKGTPSKLVYKGSLNLRGAELKYLSPALVTKMCETKKSSLFKIGKKSSDSTSLPGTEAFGFELVTTEINAEAVAPMYFSGATIPPQVASGPVRRRHILRTRTAEEQKMWYESLEKVIKTISHASRKH